MRWEKEIELLTPTFCRGAYQDTPELRAPSIRGMVRWWFRTLGGSADEEKLAFGGMKNFGSDGEVRASHLVFRVEPVRFQVANPKPAALPHKQGGMANPQAAFAAASRFRLSVQSRLSPLPPPLEKKALNALEVWLLIGSLGLRANRGGGSIWPLGESAPKNAAELGSRLAEAGFGWPVYLAGANVGQTPEQLRAAATDTVSEPAWLFGRARGGRQASVLKLKVVRLENTLRLLATAPDEKTIEEARRCLRGHRCKPEGWERI